MPCERQNLYALSWALLISKTGLMGELQGYMNNTLIKDLPDYRILSGTPEGFNPYHGWQQVIFRSSEQKQNWGRAPVGMPIGALEAPLQTAKGRGAFEFAYPPEVEQDLRDSVSHGKQFRIKLAVEHIAGIVDAVRNILLQWTIEMEKQGVFGYDLVFSERDKLKSDEATAKTVNNIHISQVGSFVQQANNSYVQGGVESNTTTELSQSTLNLVQELEALLPVSNLPVDVRGAAQATLGELKQEASAATPDSGRLRKGWESLKRVLAPAGETVIKLAVDAAVTKLLTPT